MRISDWSSDVCSSDLIAFPEPSYTAGLGGNPEFAPAAYRIGYSSMVTPDTVYDYHPADRSLEVLTVREVPSGYDAAEYESERLTITARDGAQVPVSIVYAKGFPRDGTGKLFLYGSGAYGLAKIGRAHVRNPVTNAH